jgi:hypothetical protein
MIRHTHRGLYVCMQLRTHLQVFMVRAFLGDQTPASVAVRFAPASR